MDGFAEGLVARLEAGDPAVQNFAHFFRQAAEAHGLVSADLTARCNGATDGLVADIAASLQSYDFDKTDAAREIHDILGKLMIDGHDPRDGVIPSDRRCMNVAGGMAGTTADLFDGTTKVRGGEWEVNGRCMGGEWEVHGRCTGGEWEVNGRWRMGVSVCSMCSLRAPPRYTARRLGGYCNTNTSHD